MLSRTSIAALAAVLAAVFLAVPACATSSRRAEPTAGVFDEDMGGVGGGGGGGGDGYAMAEEESSAQMHVISGSAKVGADRGAFDFEDDEPPQKEIAFSGKKVEREYRPPPAPPPPKPGEAIAQGPDKPAPVEAVNKRLVIYKGSMVILVSVVDAAIEKIAARANALGGYVENQTGNAGANNATVTMRIPAEKFYDVVAEVAAYGQVTQKQISASDVTKQLFDTELRLETAEKSRQRLLDLLKGATKMEEILQIENEVRRLTQEIETMKGELRFLKDQVAFSTLAVTFYSNAPPPTALQTRVRSRFEWINKVGIESVLSYF